MRRYQKGMVLMVEHILFAVLTAAVIGAAIFMWWFELFDLFLTGGGVVVGDGERIDMVGCQIFRQLLTG